MPLLATPVQRAALLELGLKEEDIAGFLEGRVIVYPFPTESEPGIAVLQKVGSRLRSGIVEVNDPGGGVKTLAQFRTRSERVAKTFQLSELELFGVAVINNQLRRMLLRRGFKIEHTDCPEELGDAGQVEIITKVFTV